MAYKFREEIVGKRFLSVSGFAKLKVNKISEWGWRAGVIRAASHRDNGCQDLQVLVEYDDVEWQRREWLSPHRDAVFSFFLVEKGLCWSERVDPRYNSLIAIEHYNNANNNHNHHRLNGKTLRGAATTANTVSWPAISYYPMVARAELHEDAMPVEFMQDRKLEFVDYSKLKPFADWELTSGSMPWENAVRRWAEMQDGQKILLTTPSVLVGFRVEVYRAEGTTQWYTAVIVGYNEATKDLTVTDDTVLEDHNEDPGLVQMRLIGDGVVESIMRGEVVGMTPRRSRSSTGLMTHAIVVPRPGRRPRGRPGNNSQLQPSSGAQSPVSQQLEKEKASARNNRRGRVSEETLRDNNKAGTPVSGEEGSLSSRQEDRENKGPPTGRPGNRAPRPVLEEANNASGSGGLSKLRRRAGAAGPKGTTGLEANSRRAVARNSNRRSTRPVNEGRNHERSNEDDREEEEDDVDDDRLSRGKSAKDSERLESRSEPEDEETREGQLDEEVERASTRHGNEERLDPLIKRLKTTSSTRRLRSDRKCRVAISEETAGPEATPAAAARAKTERENKEEAEERFASRSEESRELEEEEEESESRERDREPEPPPPPDKYRSSEPDDQPRTSERSTNRPVGQASPLVNGVCRIESPSLDENNEKIRHEIVVGAPRTLRLPAKDRRKEHNFRVQIAARRDVEARSEDSGDGETERKESSPLEKDVDVTVEEEVSRIAKSVNAYTLGSGTENRNPSLATEAARKVREEGANAVSRSPSVIIGCGGEAQRAASVESVVEFIESSSQDGSVLERLSPLSGGPGRQSLLHEEQERNRHNESPVILSERLNKPAPSQLATAVTAQHQQHRYQQQQHQQHQKFHYHHSQQQRYSSSGSPVIQHPHHHHHLQRLSATGSPHHLQQHIHHVTNPSHLGDVSLTSSGNNRRDSHPINQTRCGDEAGHLMEVEAGAVGGLSPGAAAIGAGGNVLGISGGSGSGILLSGGGPLGGGSAGTGLVLGIGGLVNSACTGSSRSSGAASAPTTTTTYGDSGSDSGVSSLRSAGSGDERSGSRSSALSAEELTTAVAPSSAPASSSSSCSSSSSSSSANYSAAAVAAAAPATPARVWHVQSVQHTSLLMAHPQAHPAQVPPSSTSTGNSSTAALGYQGGPASGTPTGHHHPSVATEILWRPPRYPPLPHGLLAPAQSGPEELLERDRHERMLRSVQFYFFT